MPKPRKSVAKTPLTLSTRSSPRKRKRAAEDSESKQEDEQAGENQAAKQRPPKQVKGGGNVDKIKGSPETPKKTARKVSAIKQEETGKSDDIVSHIDPADAAGGGKKARKRKTDEEKAKEAMPLAARSTGLRMFVGAHVSMAKGVQNSVTNCSHIGGNAFALFLKSQRKWDNPPLTNESRDAFRAQCKAEKYDASSHVLPHGSYLVNLAIEDSAREEQAYNAFLDDLQRCEALGIKLYNFHPGASGPSPLPAALKRIANNLNKALEATKTVMPVLENMAGSGTVIGSRFADLRDIIAHVKPELRSRVGVCLDTCHSFAAGYDLRTPSSFKAVLEEFDQIVGMKYLKALHINDSKAPLGSKKDLHQNIGQGFLGLRAFHNVMNEPRFENLPLILETPCDEPDPDDPKGKKTVENKSIWADEIKLLESLIGMDATSPKFLRMEAELGEKGRAEREKMSQSLAERDKKKQKILEKGQKTLMGMMNGVKAEKENEAEPRVRKGRKPKTNEPQNFRKTKTKKTEHDEAEDTVGSSPPESETW